MFDRSNEVVRPVTVEVLADVENFNALLAKYVAVVPSLVVVDTAESLYVVHEHNPKRARLSFRVRDERLERSTSGRAGPADRIIRVEPLDAKAMLFRVALNRLLLIGDRLFLPIGRSAKVPNGHLFSATRCALLTRTNVYGAISGMIVGITFTSLYIVYFKFGLPWFGQGTHEQWWFGISPEGIGTLGMLINFAVAISVSLLTPKPPEHIARLVETIRVPRGADEAHELSA